MPFSSVIGNRRAINRMVRFRHQCINSETKPNIALIGPASCGKTFIANIYAKSMSIPFIEIQPHTVSDMSAMYDKIVAKVGRCRDLPACVIFIDEVHNLNNKVEQGLLKAIEKNDCSLENTHGMKLRTKNVSWMIATTEWGNLFPPFKSRFTQVELDHYTKKEIAQIVKLSYPDFLTSTCKLIAKYNAIPREAIAFAEEYITAMAMPDDSTGTLGIEDTIVQCADDARIDKYGMTFTRCEVLTELGQGPVAKSRLAGMIGVGPKELVNDIMPPMLGKTKDRPIPQVSVSNQGYYITSMGLVELVLRGIDNLGHHAIPQKMWYRYPELFN